RLIEQAERSAAGFHQAAADRLEVGPVAAAVVFVRRVEDQAARRAVLKEDPDLARFAGAWSADDDVDVGRGARHCAGGVSFDSAGACSASWAARAAAMRARMASTVGTASGSVASARPNQGPSHSKMAEMFQPYFSASGTMAVPQARHCCSVYTGPSSGNQRERIPPKICGICAHPFAGSGCVEAGAERSFGRAGSAGVESA